MKNLQASIEYTLKKKEYQLRSLDSHFNESIQKIGSYLEGEAHLTTVGTSLYYIAMWNHWKFSYIFLDNTKLEFIYIEQDTYLGIESNNWEFSLGKMVEKYKQSVQFHKAIKHMAQALLLGWDDLAIKYGHLLIKMLYGKQYKGGHPAYKHPWFMLELFCKWQKIKLDYSRLNYPKDMEVYTTALKYWDTDNVELLSQLVNSLSEFHIDQSDEDEYEDSIPDFPSSDYFIYAIEILLWLNIRERMGLPDYIPDNELMKLPINNWHTQHTEIPKIELIEKAKAKLLQDYPDLCFG